MASIMSGIFTALRPMAKELIKGGLVAMDTVTEFVAETGEQFKDLVAEAKSELASADKDKAAKEETIADSGTARP